jgi:hypothetical protein
VSKKTGGVGPRPGDTQGCAVGRWQEVGGDRRPGGVESRVKIAEKMVVVGVGGRAVTTTVRETAAR